MWNFKFPITRRNIRSYAGLQADHNVSGRKNYSTADTSNLGVHASRSNDGVQAAMRPRKKASTVLIKRPISPIWLTSEAQQLILIRTKYDGENELTDFFI